MRGRTMRGLPVIDFLFLQMIQAICTINSPQYEKKIHQCYSGLRLRNEVEHSQQLRVE